MKKVYIHIGFHKTGSSALQECLAANRDVLLDGGYFYPQSLEDKYPSHADFSWAINRKPPQWSGFRDGEAGEVLDFYEQQTLQMSCDSLILSSEDFVLLESHPSDIQKLKEFFSGFEAKIVAYVRNPIDFIISLYSHAIRSRAITCDVNEYVDRHFNFRSADYSARLRTWVNVFGKENVIVRPYSSGSFVNNNLVDDFLNCIGLDVELERKELKSNVGVHPWLINGYLEIAKSELPEEEKDVALRKLFVIGGMLPKVDAAQYLMDPMLHRVIDKSYESMKNQLSKAYGVIF